MKNVTKTTLISESNEAHKSLVNWTPINRQWPQVQWNQAPSLFRQITNRILLRFTCPNVLHNSSTITWMVHPHSLRVHVNIANRATAGSEKCLLLLMRCQHAVSRSFASRYLLRSHRYTHTHTKKNKIKQDLHRRYFTVQRIKGCIFSDCRFFFFFTNVYMGLFLLCFRVVGFFLHGTTQQYCVLKTILLIFWKQHLVKVVRIKKKRKKKVLLDLELKKNKK